MSAADGIDWVWVEQLDVWINPTPDVNDKLDFLTLEEFLARYPETLSSDGVDPGEDWCGACLCGDHDQCLRTFDSMGTQPPRPCLCPHEIDGQEASDG